MALDVALEEVVSFGKVVAGLCHPTQRPLLLHTLTLSGLVKNIVLNVLLFYFRGGGVDVAHGHLLINFRRSINFCLLFSKS